MSGWNATRRPSMEVSGTTIAESTEPKLRPPWEASTPTIRKRTPTTLTVWPSARSGDRPRSSAVVAPSTATGRAWSTSNCVKKVPASTVRWLMALYCGNVPVTVAWAVVAPERDRGVRVDRVDGGLHPRRDVDGLEVALRDGRRVRREAARLHGDRVGAEGVEPVDDRLGRAATDRGQRDHRGDADHDPEDREDRPQRIGAQARERETQRLEEGPSLAAPAGGRTAAGEAAAGEAATATREPPPPCSRPAAGALPESSCCWRRPCTGRSPRSHPQSDRW